VSPSAAHPQASTRRGRKPACHRRHRHGSPQAPRTPGARLARTPPPDTSAGTPTPGRGTRPQQRTPYRYAATTAADQPAPRRSAGNATPVCKPRELHHHTSGPQTMQTKSMAWQNSMQGLDERRCTAWQAVARHRRGGAAPLHPAGFADRARRPAGYWAGARQSQAPRPRGRGRQGTTSLTSQLPGTRVDRGIRADPPRVGSYR